MKKFLAIFLSLLMLVGVSVALIACVPASDNNGDTTGDGNDDGNGSQTATVEADVYAPDGAPALALAQLMSEEMQFGGKVTYNVVAADTIQTYVTGNDPQAELCILPVNAAAMLLGTGEKYQMLGDVTHGNLYVLSAKHTEEITAENAAELLAGTKIGSLQLDNFVGFALRTVLSKYDVSFEVRSDKGETNETETAYLYNVDGTEIIPSADYDYMIAAEPAVSKKVNATKDTPKPLKVVGDLQALYGENGYPQAVLVAKKDFIAENAAFIKDFTDAVAANAAWLLEEETQAQTIYDAVVGHYLKEGTTPTFGVSDLTKEVIGACAVRFDSAASCKARVTEFLAELSVAANKTFSATDAFFYTAA